MYTFMLTISTAIAMPIHDNTLLNNCQVLDDSNPLTLLILILVELHPNLPSVTAFQVGSHLI